MRKHILLLVLTALLACTYHSAKGQPLSPTAKISVLTCGAGEELYSTFGHSAVRVCDTASGFDRVFNYGMFSFSDPNFYLNFVRGKLNYMLGVTSYEVFIGEYRGDKRWVFEQVLNFTPEENLQVFEFLVNNSLPENCEYLYDFLFDNCTTRIRDLLEKNFGGRIAFPNKELESKPTFRNMLHSYLNEMMWTRLGIDMLLGKRVDEVATPRQYMFLPDFLFDALDFTTLDGKPIVSESQYLYQAPPIVHRKPLLSPSIVFIGILVIVIAAHVMKLPLKWFDVSLFLIVGLLGILLLLMWVATDHYVTKANFNLLWALPLHAIAAFFLIKKQRKPWVLWYFAANMLCCLVLLLFWGKLPQYLNNALVPFVALLCFRCFAIAKPLASGITRRKP